MYGHEKDHQCGPPNPVGPAACTRYTYLSLTTVFAMTWADGPPSMQEPHPAAGSSSHLLPHLLHRHSPASVRRAPYRKKCGCARGKRRSTFRSSELNGAYSGVGQEKSCLGDVVSQQLTLRLLPFPFLFLTLFCFLFFHVSCLSCATKHGRRGFIETSQRERLGSFFTGTNVCSLPPPLSLSVVLAVSSGFGGKAPPCWWLTCRTEQEDGEREGRWPCPEEKTQIKENTIHQAGHKAGRGVPVCALPRPTSALG